MSESQLLIAAIPKLATAKKTWVEIMETLAWSWKVLWEGVCSKKDKDGKVLDSMKGKRMRTGVLWCITGDLDWFAEEFGFPYAAANLICPYCKADQKKHDSTMPFTDLDPVQCGGPLYFQWPNYTRISTTHCSMPHV